MCRQIFIIAGCCFPSTSVPSVHSHSWVDQRVNKGVIKPQPYKVFHTRQIYKNEAGVFICTEHLICQACLDRQKALNRKLRITEQKMNYLNMRLLFLLVMIPLLMLLWLGSVHSQSKNKWMKSFNNDEL